MARYVDFTSYTEIDTNNVLSQTSSKSSFADMDGEEECYLYYDYGTGKFNVWTHRFTFKVSDITENESISLGRLNLLCYANAVGNQYDLSQASESFLGVLISGKSDADDDAHYKITLREYNGSSFDNDASSDLAVGTAYYGKLEKDGTTCTLTIYSDSVFSTVVDTLSVTLDSDYGFRYLYCPQGLERGTATNTTGYVENLNINISYETWLDDAISAVKTTISNTETFDGSPGTVFYAWIASPDENPYCRIDLDRDQFTLRGGRYDSRAYEQRLSINLRVVWNGTYTETAYNEFISYVDEITTAIESDETLGGTYVETSYITDISWSRNRQGNALTHVAVVGLVVEGSRDGV